MKHAGLILVAAVLLSGAASAATATQERQHAGAGSGEIARAEEIALAEGAGPPALVAGATIYVFGADGYEVARQGTNGASCLVSRSRPDTLEPQCFDAEGTRSILPAQLERGRMRAAGASAEEIADRMAAGFESGEFGAPQKAGVSYMLSPHNTVFNGSEVISYPPHIMVYAPYLTNDDIGADMTDPYMPWVLNENDPHGYIIVLVGGS